MGLDIYLTIRLPGHKDIQVWSSNYTIPHSLRDMAQAAGIYNEVWRPHDLGITTASQLINHLTDGIAVLKSMPDLFKAFNRKGDWCDYDFFLGFLELYLANCVNYPSAVVDVAS